MTMDLNRLAASNIVRELLSGEVTEPLSSPNLPPSQRSALKLSKSLRRGRDTRLGAPMGAVKIPEEEVEPETAWYQHIVRPVSEALHKYHTDIIEPFAAALWSAGITALPGMQAGEREARAVQRKPGIAMPWTESGKELAEVYRKTEMPWGVKGALELAGDPLMYIGLVSGGAFLLGKAGTAGVLAAKALAPAVRVEKVVLKALALPIELPLKGAAKAAGKLAYFSPTIAGEYKGRVAWNAMRAISGKAFVKGDAKNTEWALKRVMELPAEKLDTQETLVKQAIEAVGHANPEQANIFAESLMKRTPREAADMLRKRTSRITQANRAEEIYRRYAKNAAIKRVMEASNQLYDGVWGKALRPVNLAFSKAILMFGMFTPMNVLEWGGRMANEGVLPWGMQGVNSFAAKHAGLEVPLTSLFEQEATGGIVASGLQKIVGTQGALGKMARGIDKGFFGWGRSIQSGQERFFFEATEKKFLVKGMEKVGMANDEIMKGALKILKEEMSKPAYKGIKKQLMSDLEFCVLQGNPEAILAMAEAYSIPQIRMKVFNGIIAKHPDLSPATLNYLGKANKELLARDAPAVFARARQIEREILEYTPQVVKARMDELVASLGSRQLRTQGDIDANIKRIFMGAPDVGAESDLMLRAYADMKATGGFSSTQAQKIWGEARTRQLEHADTWLKEVERGIEALNEASLKQGGLGIPQKARQLYKEKALLQVEQKKRAIALTTEFWETARAEGWKVDEISSRLLDDLQPHQAAIAQQYGKTEAELINKIEKSWIDNISPQKRSYKARLAREHDARLKAEEATKLVQARLKERIGKINEQLDKTKRALREQRDIADQLSMERSGFGELPPDDVLEAAFRTLEPESKMTLRNGLRESAEDIGMLSMEDMAERGTLKEYLMSNRLYTYRAKVRRTVRKADGSLTEKVTPRSLFSVLDRYGGRWPEGLTRKEAEPFMQGRPILPNVLNKQGKVRPEYILDDIATEFGFADSEAFKGALEEVWKQNRRLGQLQDVGNYYAAREAEINRLMELLEKSERPVASRIEAMKAKAAEGGLEAEAQKAMPTPEAGMPEAGMQAKMVPGEEIALERYVPKGKGKVTQSQLDDWQKLKDWGGTQEGAFPSGPIEAAERKAIETKAEVAAYDEVLETLEKALQPKAAEIDAIEREFMTAAREPLLSEFGQQQLGASTSRLANQIRGLPADRAAQYKKIAQEAVDKAVEVHKRVFMPPETRTSVDYWFQHFFPYWMYESRRWSYLPRLFAKRPILAEYFFPGGGRYWQHERGYTEIPGTDWQINPFRGTIIGTLARTAMKDYPPEHAGWRGDVEERVEDLGRAGLYFGPIYTMPLQVVMGEFGEAMPAPISTPISLAVTAGMPGAKEIQENLLPSRYREYYLNQALANKGIVPSEATVAQKAEALRGVNLALVLMEQSAMTRYRPQARTEYYERVVEKLEEFTGLSRDEQDRLRQQGLSVQQVYSLSPRQREELDQIEGADLWKGLALPLLPRAQQKIVSARNEYNKTLDSLREMSNEEQLKDDERLSQGLIDGKTWRDRYHERQVAGAAYGKALKASPAYADVPIGEEEWLAYREKFNIPEGYVHPVQEVLNRYYEVDPEKFTDRETGETDWGRFFEARENALARFDPELKEIALEWAERKNTPMVAEFKRGQEALREYWNIYDQVKTEHPAWARVVEQEERETNPEKALEIRQTEEYKAFRKELSRRREELRGRDPRVEYYLYVFGYITNLTNAEAVNMVEGQSSIFRRPERGLRLSRSLRR